MNKIPLWHSFLIRSLFIVCSLTLYTNTEAKEGMWLPPNLKDHEKEMRTMGLQIAIDRIYNENGTGLNNAIVLFGKGCTGEIISPKGLILTNHHCGYSSAQALSTTEKDYFANGFWASGLKEELPCKGLTVTFIRKIENVTERIIAGLADTLRDEIRDTIVNGRITAVEKEIAARTGMDATIKPYFKGNQYWVAISETYKDIRFVGFPPNGIGAFGGDVENWMWPRHTGDFSIFRVYAGADNKPADYSADNKPYDAPQFFTINISGYKENDFTMVYGFPGTTNEYISSFSLKHVYGISDPISIEARTLKLDAWAKYMNESRDVFLKYTSKKAGVANGWKKWQGEISGLEAVDATGKKQKFEKKFAKWAKRNKSMPYADSLLPKMQKAAEGVDQVVYEDQYVKETVLAIELIQQGATAERLLNSFRLKLDDKTLTDTINKQLGGHGFYKNYEVKADKAVFNQLMALYFSKCAGAIPDYYATAYQSHNNSMSAWADDIYNSSIFADSNRVKKWATNLKPADSTVLINDPAYKLYSSIIALRKQKILPALGIYQTQMRYLERLYMKGQMTASKKKILYPDANLTLRLTFGKIAGLDPEGPAGYSFQTTLGQAIVLDDPNSDIFKVPSKLKDLYLNKNFGRWGVDGDVPLAFIASNHTSGGNSGSPVLNSMGELIGTNFDRAYEGTMSDYYFDPNRCRNISVDIRYTLFIIEKFGGAGWLINEMNIVKNPY